ncbi:MAG: hypothetical protein ACR2LS_11100 [Thermomicrobiales bacterium]
MATPLTASLGSGDHAQVRPLPFQANWRKPSRQGREAIVERKRADRAWPWPGSQASHVIAGGFERETGLAASARPLLLAWALVEIGVYSPLHHDEIG